MDITLPQLAEGVESGTVVNILVSEGDKIEKDQALMELETQKAVGSIPSPESGTVTKIHVKEGQEVTVGQLLISLSTEAARAAESGGVGRAEQKVATTGKTESARIAEETKAIPESYQYESKSGLPPPAAPSVRKVARELGIDLTRVRGSEAGGRITVEDLRDYIERLQEVSHETKTAPQTAQRPALKSVDFSQWGPVRKERLSSLRRTVGRRMLESWSTIPHITQFDEADITSLLALRKKYGPAFEKKGGHLTLTAFVIKALLPALKKYPAFNSSLDESTGEIVYKDYYHLGIAVDTEAGLIVPVIRDVDKKGLLQLSIALHELTEKTRQRKVSLEELQGGTFTISNQGSIGGAHFTPIIYKPQAAILGLGKGASKPVVRQRKIEARAMLPVALSYDHRLIDGADAVRFIREVIETLENFPEEELKRQGKT